MQTFAAFSHLWRVEKGDQPSQQVLTAQGALDSSSLITAIPSQASWALVSLYVVSCLPWLLEVLVLILAPFIMGHWGLFVVGALNLQMVGDRTWKQSPNMVPPFSSWLGLVPGEHTLHSFRCKAANKSSYLLRLCVLNEIMYVKWLALSGT